MTSEEILDLLCRVIPLSSSMKGTTVVLDGFTGFTPIQNRLIGALLRHCPQVYITLTLDDGEDPFGKCSMHRLSYMTKKTIRSLCQLAREEKVFVDEPVRISDSDRDRYGKYLRMSQSIYRHLPVIIRQRRWRRSADGSAVLFGKRNTDIEILQ